MRKLKPFAALFLTAACFPFLADTPPAPLCLPMPAIMRSCSGRSPHEKGDGLALTPPMGWNSWNRFQTKIDEGKIREVADAIVRSGMRDAGYRYLVLDDGWMAPQRNQAGELYGDPAKFPSGMKSLGDYIHGKGLKFGIYECRGSLTCQRLPGSYLHEQQDMKTFASWGVDYVKLDGCYAERNKRPSDVDLAVYSEAIGKSGRPMVLSISDFGNGCWAWGAAEYAHLWRTSYDIGADMESVLYCANTSGGDGVIDPAFNGLWQFAGPGHWNDPDMLEVGNLPSAVQDRLHFSLWCILAAPLMAGNDLRQMPDSVNSILTAKEVIAIDQDPRGFQGYKVFDNGRQQVYNKPLSDGTTAVLLFNLDKDTAGVRVRWEQIGLHGSQKVRDLWKGTDLGYFNDGFEARRLPQYGHVLIKVGSPGGPMIAGPSPMPVEKFTVRASGTTWLSDIYYLMKQGQAPAKDKGPAGRKIAIAGARYEKGLGCRSGSRIMYRLDGRAARFHALVGVDDAYSGDATAQFKVYNGDFFGGQVLFDSGKLRSGSAVKVDIDVSGVHYLLLVVDGKEVDADWAEAKVVAK
ncbi:MAG TPA: NPCBM/NEW2 domain-containing protein [Puia sp.]|nr:NPCBM/NEW2 domain-containing protein [Puia sp.]